MSRYFFGRAAVGSLVAISVLVAAAAPSLAQTRGGMSGGGGWHGGGMHGGFQHASNRAFVGHHFSHHRFFPHHHFFRPCCFFGSSVFFGVGIAAPLWYPYPYPVYAPAVAESSPPVYAQPESQPQQQYWYYCQGAQAYYPYVKECPGGWLQVVPQPSPPPR
jgi:hypothetical protein